MGKQAAANTIYMAGKFYMLLFALFMRLSVGSDEAINMRTILVDGTIAGSVAKFVMVGPFNVTM